MTTTNTAPDFLDLLLAAAENDAPCSPPPARPFDAARAAKQTAERERREARSRIIPMLDFRGPNAYRHHG